MKKKLTIKLIFFFIFALLVTSQMFEDQTPVEDRPDDEASEVNLDKRDIPEEASSDVDEDTNNDKTLQLEDHSIQNDKDHPGSITTNFGTAIANDSDTLKAGERGPQLLQDFHFREKMTHFDHERIPERVVHARGFGVHGYFQLSESLEEYTKASIFTNTSSRVPVFVRFSTVAGFRGSMDTARDVRGFAIKFYTSEGNFDLVGNNIPVFFIQDGIKFPDLVHALKPEPHNEIPQASSAHDNFWDFISFTPESTHMVMWQLSDRAIPRSFRMMQGFGVHSFIFVNNQGKRSFVKFHLIPKLGIHSLVWDESQKLGGIDPDYHRNDIYDAIEAGSFPEYDLGVQIVDEADEDSFDFDLLDPTKIIPEELVPLRIIGKLVLNQNVGNFFAETEQVAFHTGHLVPGIEASDDPLLQGRMFSYTDTQLIRLGGPNFEEIPINRPLAPVNNNQRDGYHRIRIDKSKVNYWPNRFGRPAPDVERGYDEAHANLGEVRKIRGKGPKFFDHYSQARMFFESLTPWEKIHLIDAAKFELGKVMDTGVKERVVGLFSNVNYALATEVALEIGVTPPPEKSLPNVSLSPAVSQNRSGHGYNSTETRQVAFLIADGYNGGQLNLLASELEKSGAVPVIVSTHIGNITAADGSTVFAPQSLLTTKSVKYDAVVVVGGEESINTLKELGTAKAFITEAFKHYKTIAVLDEAVILTQDLKLHVQLATQNLKVIVDNGFISGYNLTNDQLGPVSEVSPSEFGTMLWSSIAAHRFYYRNVTAAPA